MFEVGIEWETAPGVACAHLAATWARVEIRAGGQLLTRFLSERSKSVRTGVYASLFPLARWVVDSWWNLVAEGMPHPDVLHGARRSNARFRGWMSRHNTLSSREGMPYPDLTVYREDDSLGLRWIADPERVSATNPGRFLESGSCRLGQLDVESGLAAVVEAVLERLGDLQHPEIGQLRADWSAVTESRKHERALCERLGALGLDPYGDDGDELEDLLSGVRLEPATLRDFLAATNPSNLTSELEAIQTLVRSLPRGSRKSARDTGLGSNQDEDVAPFRAGHDRADRFRREFGLSAASPVDDLLQLARGCLGKVDVRWVDLPGHHAVEAIVEASGRNALAGTRRDEKAERFLLARALHHWTFASSKQSPRRLLTNAHDWLQASSRAFAAELLAPAKALEARHAEGLEWDDTKRLANDFNVDAMVIAHQLANHQLS